MMMMTWRIRWIFGVVDSCGGELEHAVTARSIAQGRAARIKRRICPPRLLLNTTEIPIQKAGEPPGSAVADARFGIIAVNREKLSIDSLGGCRYRLIADRPVAT